MRILFIGDIFGKTGINAIKEILKKIKDENEIDFVIANAENATNCRGLSLEDYLTLNKYGVDFFTMGNHTWNNDDIYNLLITKANIIRPYNINFQDKFNQYGTGSKIIKIKNFNVRITNLLGNSIRFNNIQTNPFKALKEIINFDQLESDFHIVDFHSESTGEKNALFFEFKGKVSAILGTHTHIQTADERIRLGTAFITDIGSTGPSEGILGAKPENVIKYFKNEINHFIIQEDDYSNFQFCAVVIDLDEKTKKANSIKRIFIYGK
ncbi:MAG: TIGR00282 family metallophosphoesterase [Ureaplasma sp.]|nr:TIGR00282 family metallophosphoesterase [Ureaplasma sp.]